MLCQTSHRFDGAKVRRLMLSELYKMDILFRKEIGMWVAYGYVFGRGIA